MMIKMKASKTRLCSRREDVRADDVEDEAVNAHPSLQKENGRVLSTPRTTIGVPPQVVNQKCGERSQEQESARFVSGGCPCLEIERRDFIEFMFVMAHEGKWNFQRIWANQKCQSLRKEPNAVSFVSEAVSVSRSRSSILNKCKKLVLVLAHE